MHSKLFERAYLRSSGSAVTLLSRAVDLSTANAVAVTAEAASITQDAVLTLEGSNDLGNWTAISGTATLTTSTGYVELVVSDLSFRFVRLRAQMTTTGLAIISAAIATSRL
jgi:hypothetical protein